MSSIVNTSDTRESGNQCRRLAQGDVLVGHLLFDATWIFVNISGCFIRTAKAGGIITIHMTLSF